MGGGGPEGEEGERIRVQFHVSFLGHALPAVDVSDAIREVIPNVLEVHGLAMRVVGGGTLTHLWPPGVLKTGGLGRGQCCHSDTFG